MLIAPSSEMDFAMIKQTMKIVCMMKENVVEPVLIWNNVLIVNVLKVLLQIMHVS